MEIKEEGTSIKTARKLHQNFNSDTDNVRLPVQPKRKIHRRKKTCEFRLEVFFNKNTLILKGEEMSKKMMKKSSIKRKVVSKFEQAMKEKLKANHDEAGAQTTQLLHLDKHPSTRTQ